MQCMHLENLVKLVLYKWFTGKHILEIRMSLCIVTWIAV